MIVIEFKDNETCLFDEIMEVFHKYSDFHKFEVDYIPAISFPDLEILPDQRKVYCREQEVSLTTKEFNLLHYFATNAKDMGKLCAGYREQYYWFPCMQIEREIIQSLPGSAL